MCVCTFVRLRDTIRLPLDGFVWNLVYEYSSFIKIWQRMTGTLHEKQCTFFIMSLSVLLRKRRVSDIFQRKLNTHFVFNIFFPLKSCRLWDNVEKYCWAEQAIDNNTCITRRMLIAFCKHIHNIYNSYCFCTATMVARTCLSVTSYVHWPSIWTLENIYVNVTHTVPYDGSHYVRPTSNKTVPASLNLSEHHTGTSSITADVRMPLCGEQ